MEHFISLYQLSVKEIKEVLQLAKSFEEENYRLDKELFIANLFFEPSTRTKSSFEVAEKRLGMQVLDFAPERSSVAKGESLYDTAKTFEAIGANALVIRHEDDDWGEQLKEGLSIPVFNAGAGKKEHPTQSLLDLYTIKNQFGSMDGLKITIVGDIKHSRVAHSNAYAFERFGAKVRLCAAEAFVDDTLPYPYISIDEAAETSDVLMMLRVQHERHPSKEQVDNYLETYGLTVERERRMKKDAILLHPAPINRGVEIDSSLVECERSRIFEQMKNGVFIRMAILTTILKKWGIINDDDFKKC